MALSPELETENLGLGLASGGIVTEQQMLNLLLAYPDCTARILCVGQSEEYADVIYYDSKREEIVYGRFNGPSPRVYACTVENFLDSDPEDRWSFQFIDEPKSVKKLVAMLELL